MTETQLNELLDAVREANGNAEIINDIVYSHLDLISLAQAYINVLPHSTLEFSVIGICMPTYIAVQHSDIPYKVARPYIARYMYKDGENHDAVVNQLLEYVANAAEHRGHDAALSEVIREVNHLYKD